MLSRSRILFYVNSVHVSPCMSVTLLPNHEQVALNLLEKGAEIDKTEEDGWTALMFACQDGHSEVCIAFSCCPDVASISREFSA